MEMQPLTFPSTGQAPAQRHTLGGRAWSGAGRQARSWRNATARPGRPPSATASTRLLSGHPVRPSCGIHSRAWLRPRLSSAGTCSSHVSLVASHAMHRVLRPARSLQTSFLLEQRDHLDAQLA